MFSGDYMIYMAIVGVMTMIGGLVGSRLKSKIQKYSQIPLSSGLSGKEVAQRMLEHYGIHDVQVLEGRGSLTDHYNPGTKTVKLSPEIFHGRHIAAAGVAAHEVGHAVQHAEAYGMLQMRSALVPVVNFAAQYQQYALMGAFMFVNQFPSIMLVAIAFFMMTTLFSLVTLPVEFDATRRGLTWLDESGVAQGEEYDYAKDALKWAAMTYVVAALSSLIALLYLIFRYLGSKR